MRGRGSTCSLVCVCVSYTHVRELRHFLWNGSCLSCRLKEKGEREKKAERDGETGRMAEGMHSGANEQEEDDTGRDN